MIKWYRYRVKTTINPDSDDPEIDISYITDNGQTPVQRQEFRERITKQKKRLHGDDTVVEFSKPKHIEEWDGIWL